MISKQSCTVRRMRPAERIERLLLDRGVKPREVRRTLSEVCGISVQAVGQWFTTDTEITAKNLQKIASHLGTTVEHLLTGRELRLVKEGAVGYGTGKVPVVGLSSARVVCLDHSTSPATMATDWRLCPVEHGPRTFAFRQQGDAMASQHPNTKTYPSGCLVYVDPDKAPEPGQAVLAALDNGEMAFRVLQRDAGREWLMAINPAFPSIMDGFRVAGTVIGKWEDA